MSEAFLHLLRGSSRKRVPLLDVKRAFFEAHPEALTSPSRHEHLLSALRGLESSCAVQLPAAGSWERVGNPPLPNWVQLVRDEPAQPSPDYSQVPWVPELGFWTDLKPSALEAASAVNDFLLRRRKNLLLAPIKERSLEIFGDEKRLDTLETGGRLFAGRLPLSAIGAFKVPLPLPYRMAEAPGMPVLVVENHNSYWSFGEWNQTAKRYSAVVYGSGEAFRSTGAALGQVLREVQGGGAEYLGDLDPKGVRIPQEFNGASAMLEPRVQPANDWYRWLLQNGRKREKPECATANKAHALAWLGEDLGEELAAVWRAGLWIPQEGLGYEQLAVLTA